MITNKEIVMLSEVLKDKSREDLIELIIAERKDKIQYIKRVVGIKEEGGNNDN